MVFSPRLLAMRMIAVTMASPFTLVIMSRTNARSIFRQSIGRFLR